jgi:hypothetical protein
MKITQHFALKLTHLLNAKNRRGFGIHSPFLFGLVQQVLRNKHPYYCFAKIEAIRNSLRHSNQKIFVQDFGTGKSGQRSIAKIATSLSHCEGVEWIPYHAYGGTKATFLGCEDNGRAEWIPTEEQLKDAKFTVQSMGAAVL